MLTLTPKIVTNHPKTRYFGTIYKRVISSSTIKTKWASLYTSSQPKINPSNILSNIMQYTYQKQNNQLFLSQEVVQQILNYDSVNNGFITFPKEQAIYANNNVDFSKIRAIGFDYDYTLCHYTPLIHDFIYNSAKQYLTEELGFPCNLKYRSYEHGFPIRSLMYDKKTGLLFKLDYFNNISTESCYKGKRKIYEDEILDLYKGKKHLSSDYINNNLYWMTDLFSYSKTCLLADIIDYFERNIHISYDPQIVLDAVNLSIDYVHDSGLLRKEIKEKVELYLEPSNHLKDILMKWKNDNKQLYIISNAKPTDVNVGMNFLLGNEWKKYFDFIVCQARKPLFFNGCNSPFKYIDDNYKTHWNSIDNFQPHQMYINGSYDSMKKYIGWKDSDSILYFGDSRSDLVEPSRKHGIITGAIVRELEDEITHENRKEYRDRNVNIEALYELRNRINKLNVLTEGDRLLISRINEELEKEKESLNKCKNKYFGSIFRSENIPTAYSIDLIRYADLYTSKLENFLKYPSKSYFLSNHFGLSHENHFKCK